MGKVGRKTCEQPVDTSAAVGTSAAYLSDHWQKLSKKVRLQLTAVAVTLPGHALQTCTSFSPRMAYGGRTLCLSQNHFLYWKSNQVEFGVSINPGNVQTKYLSIETMQVLPMEYMHIACMVYLHATRWQPKENSHCHVIHA